MLIICKAAECGHSELWKSLLYCLPFLSEVVFWFHGVKFLLDLQKKKIKLGGFGFLFGLGLGFLGSCVLGFFYNLSTIISPKT